MGRYNVTLSGLIIFLFLFPPFSDLVKAQEHEQEEGFEIYGFTIPGYNSETGKLEYVIRGKKAEKLGVMVNLEDVRIDWVEGEISAVKAVVFTPSAVYNYATKEIKGEKQIHYRSPEMDVDGVGFDIDQDAQLLHIRSCAKVKLKQSIGAERGISAEIPEEKKSSPRTDAGLENSIDKEEK